jgi:two-component system, NarL family, nitrate/nitrite sensor histidine kinase NarX
MLVSPAVIWIAVLAAGAAAAAAVFFAVLQRRSARHALAVSQANERLMTAQQERLSQLDARLKTVLQLNRDLVEAGDETALVRAALTSVNFLVAGLGSTYVPFDAWGQPLPAFTYGEMPEPVLKGWAEHLVSEHVRQRCSSCRELHAGPGQSCPLQFGPFGGTLNIYCLPLALGSRRLGMVNIYLPADRLLSEDLHQFLSGLLHEMALAVETQRLHAQEVETLRQLHRLRTPRAGLTSMLEALLESIQTPLSLDALMLRVRPMSTPRLSDLEVVIGDRSLEIFGRIEEHWSGLLEGEEDCADCFPEGISWLALPLTLPEGQVLGALIAARRSDERFTPSQKGVLETAAAQAALMIENERLNMSLEYTLVIQERTRLAREIHDGLAQTLAYLKMQAAQMQSALTQGDTQRLARLLHENRQALSDAYNETRQAIDNLRVNPEEGLLSWLAQAAIEFEQNAALHVVTDFPETEPGLLPEIQAQMIRIIQEALNNVRKHAHAREVRILLRSLDSGDQNRKAPDWILEIVDDGCGFNPEDVPIVARYGLRGMRERAELMGSEFQIISQPGHGTKVVLFVPVQVEEVGD